jgi:diguanylate cyclase (GGDEF)-like protein
LDRVTGFAAIKRDVRLKIEIMQMDTRARLGWMMAVVGVIVLLAMVWSFRGNANPAAFYLLAALVSLAYAGILGASVYWRRSRRKMRIFSRFQKLYCGIQLLLGASWGGVIATSLPQAGPVQQGQIYAILIGLVSTAVFSGPAIYSLCFWTPLTLLSVLGLLNHDLNINGATLTGVISYFALTLFSIISLNKKLLEREVNAIQIQVHKEETDLLLRDFQEGISDWRWDIDAACKIVNPSERFCAVAGRSRAEMQTELLTVLSRSSGAQLYPSDDTGVETIKHKLAARAAFRDVIVQVTIGQQTRWWELSGRPVMDAQGGFLGYRGVGRDVTDMYSARERVNFLAAHDSLTGLLNRESFTQAIRQAYDSGAGLPTALLCVDLDFFKSINDSFGHAAGDSVLFAVAERLRGCVRQPDQVFRLGGDEFAVLLFGAERELTSTIAQRITERLSQPFSVGGLELSLGASLGVAFIPGDGRSPEEVHHNADLALYRAKEEGRGTVRFFDAGDEQSSCRLYIKSRLSESMEDETLFIEYQPIVDLNTRRIVSAEALLRWSHRNGSTLEPNLFIPLLERGGRIPAIGLQVIEQAVRVAGAAGGGISMAINLSPLQLADVNLPRLIEDVLNSHRVSPARINFEITESSLLDHDSQRLAVLSQIKSIGCGISLDDFGTGYSSLSLLGAFAFDRLKIDGSFTRSDLQDRRRRTILRTMFELSAKLGLAVVGEGIETEAQAAQLADLGCVEGQGFLFYRPMPESRFLELSQGHLTV